MISQLIYTSAPSGLSPGSSGYCTVQSSRGIPAPTVDLLESLSGYRHLFTPGSPEAKNNPVNYGHYILRISGKKEHVLSRVSDCDLDHTGRSNKLAHHMIVDKYSSVKGGSAWLLQQPGWLVDQWDGEVKLIDAAPALPTQPRPVAKCTTWETVCGDAGWAGVMAQAFLDDPQRKVFLIYQPGTDVLALFEEAISLLPESRRWDVTFSTYAAALPSTVDCLWSGIIADSQDVHLSKRFVNALRIDLPTLSGSAPAGLLVDVARTGKPPSKPVVLPAQPKEKAADSPVIKEPKLEADTYQIAAPQLKPSTTPNLPPSIPLRKKTKKKSSLKHYLVLLTVLCFIAAGGAYAYINNQKANQAQQLAEIGKEHSPEIPEEDSTAITPEDSAVKPFQQDIPETVTEETEPEMQEKAASPKEPVKPETPPPEKSDSIPAVEKPEEKKDREKKPVFPGKTEVFYAQNETLFLNDKEVPLQLEEGWNTNLPPLSEMEIDILFAKWKDSKNHPKINISGKGANRPDIEYKITPDGSSAMLSQPYSIITLVEQDGKLEIKFKPKSRPTSDEKQIIMGLGIRFKWKGNIRIVAVNHPAIISHAKVNVKTDMFSLEFDEEDSQRLRNFAVPNVLKLSASDSLSIFTNNKIYSLPINKDNSFHLKTNDKDTPESVHFVPRIPGESNGTKPLKCFMFNLLSDRIDNEIEKLKKATDGLRSDLQFDWKLNQSKFSESDDTETDKVLLRPSCNYESDKNNDFQGLITMKQEKIKNDLLGLIKNDLLGLIKEKRKTFLNTFNDYLTKRKKLWDDELRRDELLNIKKSTKITKASIYYSMSPLEFLHEQDDVNSHRIELIRIDDTISE